MGKEMYCDLCRKNIAVESQIIPIIIGKNTVAEFCITCSSSLEQGVSKSIADAKATVDAAKATVPAAQAPPVEPQTKAPPEVPAAAQESNTRSAG